MKKYVRFIAVTIMLALIMNLSKMPSFARSIGMYDKDITLAKVVEVISGEALKVIEFDTSGNGRTVLIKMVGITTDSSQEAVDYAYKHLLGQRVMLLPDSQESTFKQISGWTYKYVYLASTHSMSEELLELGLAKIDNSFEKAEQYSDLLKAELKAKEEKKGVWEKYDDNTATIGLNINTASTIELTNILEDTTSTMAYSIVNYREHNPYNTIEEIKFTHSDFNKTWYDKNKHKLSVVTNISKASFEELKSLFIDKTLGETLANNIVQYRLFNFINSMDEVKKIPNMLNHFSKIENYIALKPTKVFEEKEVTVVNLNTASSNQIKRACYFSTSKIDKIIKERNEQKYIIKSLGELEKKEFLTAFEVSRYGDNLSLFTNINTAGEKELQSLFGMINISDESRDILAKRIIDNRPYKAKSDIRDFVASQYYNKFSPYIYAVQSEIPEYININITDRAKAAGILGMNYEDTKNYTKSHIHYRLSENLKFDYETYASKFSLFTNLNTASKYELENIYGRIWKDSKYQYVKLPKEIIDDILTFREDQPFSTLDEVSEIFTKHKQTSIYNNVKGYFVFY